MTSRAKRMATAAVMIVVFSCLATAQNKVDGLMETPPGVTADYPRNQAGVLIRGSD